MGKGLSKHSADFSPERRATIQRYLRAEVVGKRELSREALELLAVGLFICDENGHFTKDEVTAAARDHSVVNAARNALDQAGL